MSRVFLQKKTPGHADVYVLNPHSIEERFVVKDYSRCTTDRLYSRATIAIARTEYDVLFDMSESTMDFSSCLQLHDNGVIFSDDKVFPLCLALPFCNGGDLFEFVNSRDDVTYSDETGDRVASVETQSSVRRFAKQMITGVSDLHHLGWAHGDVSLENFLLHDGNVLLFDYGQAVKITDTRYKLQGKSDYHPPELIQSLSAPSIYWPAVDCYAIGVCIFAMVFGTPPSGGCVAIERSFQLIADEHLKDLIRSLLHPKPAIRLTARNALNHKYFDAL